MTASYLARRFRHIWTVEQGRPARYRPRRDHREHPPGSARHPGPRPGRLPRHQPRTQRRWDGQS